MADILLELRRAYKDETANHDVGRARILTLAIDEIDRLRDALGDIEEIADDGADVDDGQPNDAMRILVIVRTALA